MDDPIVSASRRRDLFEDIVAADTAAAQARERKEKRVFILACSAVIVLFLACAAFVVIALVAMTNQREAREAASRRIDILNQQIDELGKELTAEARTNGARIGELTEQVSVLQEQVRQLGGEPVVVNVAEPRSSPTPATTTTTTPSPTTTTTTPPDPQEEPPDDGTCLLGFCIGAST